MIKQMLERQTGHLSNVEFAKIAEMVTDDIKFNRIKFGKCTSLEYVSTIAERSAIVLKRCNYINK
ncbi:hypothetical protein RBU49_11775 [Clostridium sp. MB40-C1]|uniref:hypothetical protein n=1 Tax=Clostridium sp. MB40-C1 TaxID=3070996 RepID=UPI0027DEC8B0|nr:hypothetical protein [Clostridium sp. MB40-C1]WMJ79568.1 hypothetical protein RBU49_11775 [Clostridium sp. MB40-C1]